MTREQAISAGWNIQKTEKTPPCDGNTELEVSYGEVARPLHREQATTLEDLLAQIESYE